MYGYGAESARISSKVGIRIPVEGARLTGREVDMLGPPAPAPPPSGDGSGDKSRGDGLGDKYDGAWLRILECLMSSGRGGTVTMTGKSNRQPSKTRTAHLL